MTIMNSLLINCNCHCLYEKAVSYRQWGLSVVVSVGPFRWPVDLIYKRFWRGE